MDPVSPWPAFAALGLAGATCALLTWRRDPPAEFGRFTTIDGLRGYLAICVFLSHGCLWYFYLRTGRWVVPPSRLYTHLGQSSVAMFFMITAFLFATKIFDARPLNIDWTRLLISRFLRLGPAYFFSVLWVFVIAGFLSKGRLNESIPLLSKHLLEWLTFTVLGGPNINGVRDTAVILVGVTWSLPYEWFFYLGLPLLALCVCVTPPVRFVLLAVGSVFAFSWLHPDIHHLTAFLGGIAAALLARSESFRIFSARRATSLLIVAGIAGAATAYPSALALAPLLILSGCFACIACGNSLFGLFEHPISLALGRMAYSIYLLHGILLFVTFNFVVGLETSRTLSPTVHWLVVLGVTPILVIVCHASFELIERPAMHGVPGVMTWLRTRSFAGPNA